jgi:4-hydroxybenzoate polyprenyltransferase
MIREILQLIRFDKPTGTLLLLWPTLWGLWMASNGSPSLSVVFKMILGTFVLRSAGCVINDIFDKEIDRHVERTRYRPITSGRVSVRIAVIVFMALMMIGAMIALSLGTAVFRLALIGAIFVIIYPLAKRYISAPQAILGIAFSWGIPMAYSIYYSPLPFQAWAFFGLTNLWVVAYDTEYALVDIEDDLKVGIHSTAILFGNYSIHIIAIFIFGLIIFGNAYGYGTPYFISVLAVMTFFIYQVILIRNKEPNKCFKAFNNNGIAGGVIWLGIVLDTSPLKLSLGF